MTGDVTLAARLGRSRSLPLVTTLAVVVVVQVLIAADIGPFGEFPLPTEVAAEVVSLLGETETWEAIGHTLQSSVLGLLIAVVLSLPLGILVATSKVFFHATRVIVEFLRPIPPITFVPLAILLYGTSIRMKLLLVVFGCFWVLLLQVVYGVQSVDATLRETARAYRFTGWQRFRHLLLPSAAPYMATGIRLAATFAVGLSIVSELVGGADGLGLSIFTFQIAGQQTSMFAVVMISALLGMAIELVLRRAEARVLSWHELHREEVR